jgi:uncharacterized protein YlxW (UPF0749 family)
MKDRQLSLGDMVITFTVLLVMLLIVVQSVRLSDERKDNAELRAENANLRANNTWLREEK